jgi:cytochrome d ubiquinol oxidase subunit II
MSLAEVPVVVILAGLALYSVLAGADFGAGFWQLTGGSSPRGRELREHAHHSIGPVWEANHVWLIFVLVVCWTAYPTAFGSIASTLAIPLFIAGIGIVLRGTAYALRSGAGSDREERALERGFAASSILTPFALGAAIGAIASGRVPVGNAQGDLFTSWLNPTSAAIGVIAVATAAYLAAVYLAADAARLGRPGVERAYRERALVMAGVAGAAALAGLFVVRDDATNIWDGLTSGAGLAAVVVSALAGLTTVVLVVLGRYGWGRVSAGIAVTAIIAGWGLAQRPQFLPGLTIEQAAAGRSTLVSLLVALALGALILVPSLGFLFSLVLRGRFDEGFEAPPQASRAPLGRVDANRLLLTAVGLFGLGAGVMFVFDGGWTIAAGVTMLLCSVGLGFVSLASLELGSSEPLDE